jgi:hypothetical protein
MIRISWLGSDTRISRAGQLLAQPAQPMHFSPSKMGRPRKVPGGTSGWNG